MLRVVLSVLCLSLALVFALPVAAQEAATVQVATDAALGPILTDAEGMTLYLFTKDEGGVSVCYDECAQRWPPLLVEGAPVAPEGLSGELGVTERTDGTWQVTYNGWPLYYFAADTAAGDTTGQGVGEVWYVVPPDAAGPAEAMGPGDAEPTEAAGPEQLPNTGADPSALGVALTLALGALGLTTGLRLRRR